jgi:predicted transcriptional regulator
MNAQSTSKRSVLMSVRPRYIEKILSGEKTVELRRRFPDTSMMGAQAFLYSSSPTCAVVAQAVIGDVKKLSVAYIWRKFGAAACISKEDFQAYFEGLDEGVVIILDDVLALKEKVGVAELREEYGIVPPQSYRYLSSGHNSLLNDDRIQVFNRHEHCNRS